MKLLGWISEFSEQGMEGETWRVFQDARFSESRTSGWNRDGMLCLAHGDSLTLHDELNRIIWAGQLTKSQTGWLVRRVILPCDTEWCPPDVTPETWASWFQASPPMIAVLERPDVS